MEIHLRTVVVDCEDGRRAANFYSKLLGWPITMEDNGWVLLRTPTAARGFPLRQRRTTCAPSGPRSPASP